MPSDDISRAPVVRELSQESGGGGRRFVLGSGSPRRKELLGHLGLEFEIVSPEIDESMRPGEDPLAYVARLSVEKADAVAGVVGPDAVIVAADTTVAVEGQILAKPEDAHDARRMLRLLSGRVHEVHTGVAVRSGGRVEAAVATTEVRFVSLTDAQIDGYLATGEPFDKAGAYALQGAGGRFVERVDGSVSNVIGLPLTLLVELFARHGVVV